MSRPPIDLHQKVRNLLSHLQPPPPESGRPIDHFERSLNDSLALIKYIDDHVAAGSIYESVYERHMSHLRRMVLGSLIQAFERYIKEIAVVCVDHVAEYVYDGRFDDFEASGNSLAINFGSGSIGRAMCESGTWLHNDSINKRFRRLLQMPFGDLWEFLFPAKKQEPAGERPTACSLAILWQIRHNIAHNVGLLTRSDAIKLRLLVEGAVESEKVLSPELADLRYVKRFLSETAKRINLRVGDRLARVLTEIHEEDSTLFDAQAIANRVSDRFGYSLTVHACVGIAS